jgi:N-acetylglucosaminyldiphosphoundecaprenol N-acetyl-beta-D-mannosaminyltransferase
MTTLNIERYSLLGIEVDAATLPDLYEMVSEAVAKSERRLIVNHNLHSVYLYHHDRRVAQAYDRADCLYADGMQIVFLARALGLPLRREHRTTFLDSFEALAGQAARRRWRLFYLGSKPGVAIRGAEMLRQRFPELEIATQDGYFDARPGVRENQKVVETINAFRPHVLMVGMGMPRQEHWIIENLDAISANAIFTCGATMDYLTSEIPTPPRWAGPLGAYGLVRLMNEPRRLWKRYLLEPWFVAGLFARNLLRIPRAERLRTPAPRRSVQENQQA